MNTQDCPATPQQYKDMDLSSSDCAPGCTSTPLISAVPENEYDTKNNSEIANLSNIMKESESSINCTAISLFVRKELSKEFPLEGTFELVSKESTSSNTTVKSCDIQNFKKKLNDSAAETNNINEEIIYCDDEQKELDDQEIERTLKDDFSVLLDVYPGVLHESILDTLETPSKYSEKQQKLPVNRGLQVFDSSNPKENEDNNDPKWEVLKQLKSDEDIFKAVQNRWTNLGNPDPRVNLSSFNWRKKNNLGPLINIKYAKKHASRMRFGAQKYTSKKHCTYIFENIKNDLKMLFNSELSHIERVFRNKMESLAERHTREYYPNANYYSSYQKEVIDLENHHKEQNYQLKVAFQQRLDELNSAREETERVYQFFGRLYGHQNDNPMFLDGKQFQHWVDIENAIAKYSEFYN